MAGSWHEEEPLLAQPLLRGVGEGLFGLAGPEGLMALSAHRRIRMVNPQGSGSSACASIAGRRRAGSRGRAHAGRCRLAGHVHARVSARRRRHRLVHGAQRPAVGQHGARPPRRARVPGLGAAAARRSEDSSRRARGPFSGQRRAGTSGREIVHLLMVLRGPRSVALTRVAVAAGAPCETVLRSVARTIGTTGARGDWRLFVEDTSRTVLEPGQGALRR